MTIYFIVFFTLIIINSLMVIFSKNSVTSVLYLISVFIFVSLTLLLIGAEFLAILIIIIYIGAISILFLFVIMMLNLRIVEVYSSLVNMFPIGIFLGLFAFAELFYVVKKDSFIFNFIPNNHLEFNIMDNNLVYSESNLYLIGDLLFNHYYGLLVIAGLILLLAMVGAIVLTNDKTIVKRLDNKNTKSSITFWGVKKIKKI